MPRLLVLRPEPGASATVERARQFGLDAISAPLFALEAVPWKAPDPNEFDGLLLTSANAVRHAGRQLQALLSLKVYAVGEATADAARNRGFALAVIGNSGVEELLGSIGPRLRLLHLCGADRIDIAEASQSIAPIIVYRAKQIETPDLSEAPGNIALVHSPRAGRRFAELVQDRDSIGIAAISPAAANAAGTGWKMVATAPSPSDHALLALATRLCNNPPQQ